jgi:hypothetical protein
VAVILPGDGCASEPRDIRLYRRDGALRTISDLHPAYAPLYYVLLFPWGEAGWHPDMPLRLQPGQQQQSSEENRLTLTRFVAYRLHARPGEFSTILRAGRLLQRYVVDMFAIADQNRLRYIHENQSELRAALYGGLEDALTQNDSNINLSELGQRYILPSSYVGGPRYMYQHFQDSLAIARYYHKVDLFITMTCNPHWVEIERELLPGQTAYDRPDLVVRVFHLKKNFLIDLIYKYGIFGHAAAYIYSIEFQKRGLPHIHLLVFLQEPYKILTPESIDSSIWA